jgi:hypothetical protein
MHTESELLNLNFELAYGALRLLFYPAVEA